MDVSKAKYAHFIVMLVLSLFLSLSLPSQLPHHPGNQLLTSCDQLLEQTVDCVVGLSQQDFSSVISGLASLLQELIKVSRGWHSYPM